MSEAVYPSQGSLHVLGLSSSPVCRGERNSKAASLAYELPLVKTGHGNEALSASLAQWTSTSWANQPNTLRREVETAAKGTELGFI
jgi:hypothetical protein